VLCTSKTRAELEPIRFGLSHRHPFIVENGGAVLIPEGYFTASYSSQKSAAGYRAIEIGIPYSLLRMALKEIGRDSGSVLTGFGDMDLEEIVRRTKLSPDEAGRAKVREYDEPFLIDGTPQNRQKVLNQIESKGFRWTRGGRFYHLTGDNDKGRAVGILTELYRADYGPLLTVGLGDSLNDLPMLAAVDRPILLQKPDGSFEKDVALPTLERVEGIGPVGWNRAVLKFLAATRG